MFLYIYIYIYIYIFWIKVIMKENRLIKWVVEEAMQMEKKSNVAERLGEVASGAWFGWYKGGRTVESLSMTEIGMILRDSAWRKVKWKWEVEAQEQSKFGVMHRLLVHGSKDRFRGVRIGAWM